jgi:hypothetical protein
MKRTVAIGLTLGLLVLAAPAHARYGKGSVDTWLVRSDGKTVGQREVNVSPVPMMTMHLASPLSSKTVTWMIRNRGGLSVHDLTFRGCATGGGVGFRYFRPSGREVTRRVVDGGYTAHAVEQGDTAKLTVRVAWRSNRDERTCTLNARFEDVSGTDSVNLHVLTG